MPDSTHNRPDPLSGAALPSARRFWPLLLTRCLSTFGDQLFGAALIGMITYRAAAAAGPASGTSVLIGATAGAFAVAFVSLSALAGQLSDKLDKALLIRRVKLAGIAIMALAAAATVLPTLPLLMLAAFAVGAQWALLGPVKHAVVPAQMHSDELTAANAYLLSATMIAILLGTLAAGPPSAPAGTAVWRIGAALVGIAVLGYAASLGIPRTPAASPGLRAGLNVVASTWQALLITVARREILLSVLGVGWFWFLITILLVELMLIAGGLARIGPLLAIFTAGIVAGSWLSTTLSGHRVEIGLVPLGAFGMTVFAADLSIGALPLEPAVGGFGALVADAAGRRTLIDVFAFATAAALYVVPLYALIQLRGDRPRLSRVVAAGNVVNLILIAASAAIALALASHGFTAGQAILAATCMHVAVAAFIFFEIPEFAMRLVVWLITHSLYRLRCEGVDHIPDSGPAVLVSNHTSLVDALVITSCCRRPVRFVIYHKIYRWPFLNLLFRASKAIPIAPSSEDAELLDKAYDEIAETLERGGLIGIFPEGQLTNDGEIKEFKPGVERIVERTPAPVVPIALVGLWGTFFSRADGHSAMSHWPRHWLALIRMRVGPPVAAEGVDAQTLRQAVVELHSTT